MIHKSRTCTTVKIALLKIVCTIHTLTTTSVCYSGLTDTLTSLRIALANISNDTKYVTMTFLKQNKINVRNYVLRYIFFFIVIRKLSCSIYLRSLEDYKAANSNRVVYIDYKSYPRRGVYIDKVPRQVKCRTLGRFPLHLLDHSYSPRKWGSCKSLLYTDCILLRRNSHDTGIYPPRRKMLRLIRDCRSCKLND